MSSGDRHVIAIDWLIAANWYFMTNSEIPFVDFSSPLCGGEGGIPEFLIIN